MRILVTGANGFIGKALVRYLVEHGFGVRGAIRTTPMCENQGIEYVVIGDIGPATAWSSILIDIDCVVHLAAHAHVMNDRASDVADTFSKVNVQGTRRLAQQVAESGVKRFVYVSSAGVMGNQGVFTEESPPCPQSLYARSKLAGEQALQEVAKATGLEIVIVRPPLVYGPGNPGNFLRLLHWVNKGLPTPFASINNQRSFIGLDNLVDFLAISLTHPRAANEVFLVADDEAISTPELIKRLACSLGVQARLLPCPVTLLRLGASLLGQSSVMARLTDSFVLNSNKAQRLLGWAAKTSLTQGLKQTAQWYKQTYD
ncbi:MAG: NAD-dependent epimerase/dehydratase family protein [Nitrospira sp.]|nr:NAD-dependent epimerase/dehydratase family protein [Nitrospira sp.]MCP9463397.1 NAD-dependent epimerase/dehydratase family protein [Nitrospira sp.]